MATVSDIIRIDGVFYDTKKLAAMHPGGSTFVEINNMKDGTAIFNMSHRRAFPHDKYKAYVVANPDPSVVKSHFADKYEQDFTLFFQICKDIAPVLRNNGFAPWHYYLKVLFLVGGLLCFDAYFLLHGRTLIMSLVCALFAAWIGLNVQHDANHGAVSRNPIINRALGMTQDLIGGCGLMWMLKHNTQHHVACNDTERDVDLAIPLLRLHNKAKWQPPYVMQHLYYTMLEAGFGPFTVLFNWFLVIRGPVLKEHKILAGAWNAHRALITFSFIRCVVGFALEPTWATVGNILAFYCFGGLYLAFFFLMSHNFVGVEKESIDSMKGCFVKHQTITSSNVGGWFLAQCNGGLNYQIEHHLFPRIHHSFYPYIAPIVKKRCLENGIKYTHFPTIMENAASTFEHLRQLGVKPTAMKAH